MTPYVGQIEAALQAVDVTSATSFTWFGERSGRLPRPLARALAPESARELLIDGLQDVLYASFYTQGRPVPASMSGSPGQTDRAFVDALSRANRGSGGWQSGWRVERVDSGVAEVVRDGLRARVPLADCRGTGALVSVRRPKEAVGGASGFYLAFGDLQPVGHPDGIGERVYFNVRPQGALRLVAGCTRLFNDAGIPFDLKVFDDPASAVRCDAAVLYLERGGFRRAREHLRTIVAACRPHLHGEPPAFGPRT